MMSQHELDETYNPLRMFASPNKIPTQKKNGSSDQGITQNQPMNTDTTSEQAATVHLIPFDPDQMIQNCDDFSISSCEAQSFLDDDFEFASSNSDAFWEQGVNGVVTAAPILGRQVSVSNVSLSSADDHVQTANSQEEMQLSWQS